MRGGGNYGSKKAQGRKEEDEAGREEAPLTLRPSRGRVFLALRGAAATKQYTLSCNNESVSVCSSAATTMS